MATPVAPLSLVLPTTIYRYFFACAEINTFQERYTAVLLP